MTIEVHTLSIADELGALAGTTVELVERRLGQASVFMVMPADRAAIRSPFWLAVQASPSQGVWDSPEAAVVAFAAGVAGWMAAAPDGPAVGLPEALRVRLTAGPVPAAQLIADFAAAGFSHDKLSRVARSMGVVRTKAGMHGGWLWSLPNTAAAACEGGGPQPSSQSTEYDASDAGNTEKED